MKYRITLTVTSLIATISFACHWGDEISRGLEQGTLPHFLAIVILIVWACGPLLLADQRSGYILMLVGGIFGLAVLITHMSGAGMLAGRIANTSGIFFWVITLITLGVTSGLSVILAASGLWNSRQTSRS